MVDRCEHTCLVHPPDQSEDVWVRVQRNETTELDHLRASLSFRDLPTRRRIIRWLQDELEEEEGRG